jgi:CelD/BcsL family acetyltransferase involved in cellulose biosynthesis
MDMVLEGTAELEAAPQSGVDARQRAHRISAEILQGDAPYRALRAEWHQLAESQRSPALFQSPDILAAWARAFAVEAGSLATVVVRDDGRPVLIWPLFIEKQALVRIARGAGAPIGQYDEFLLDPDCDAAGAFDAAMRLLAKEARADVVVLERVRADAALRKALQDTLPVNSIEAAPYADLSGGVPKLMTSLKSRVVRQQKKRVRRFEQEGTVAFEVAASPKQARDWLTDAMALKREWLRTTGRLSRAFVKPEMEACLADCATALARPDASPGMVVCRLTLDGRTAAIEMGFRQGDVYHLYLGAFTPEFGKFGPGNILTQRLLEWCAANGITRYDMLAPRTRNKSEWQTDEVAVHDFALPTTLRGRLYVALILRRLIPGMRRCFYALPAGVRSRVAGLALRGQAQEPHEQQE